MIKFGQCFATASALKLFLFVNLSQKKHMLVKEALETIGGLSNPSKMPCKGYSIPAQRCNVGSKLRTVKGSVCDKCYALKGMYVFNNVKNALELRYQKLNYALNTDTKQFREAFKVLLRKQSFFRWHDSGDLINSKHLSFIVDVAKDNPGVKFWLPTRESKTVSEYVKTGKFPKNLNVRLSAMKINGKASEKLARNAGATVSGVHSKLTEYLECPAYKQNNECRDCRACWNRKTFAVSYRVH